METTSNSDPVGDPLIEEVRAVRRAIRDEDGNDLTRHLERLKNIERQHLARIAGKHPMVPIQRREC